MTSVRCSNCRWIRYADVKRCPKCGNPMTIPVPK